MVGLDPASNHWETRLNYLLKNPIGFGGYDPCYDGFDAEVMFEAIWLERGCGSCLCTDTWKETSLDL